jgi:hypothetical protein
MIMPNRHIGRAEATTGIAGPADEELRIIQEGLVAGSRSPPARSGMGSHRAFCSGDAPDGRVGVMAAGSIEPVVGASEGRKLENHARRFKRLLSRKTLENEALREALAQAGGTWSLPSSPTDASR